MNSFLEKKTEERICVSKVKVIMSLKEPFKKFHLPLVMV